MNCGKFKVLLYTGLLVFLTIAVSFQGVSAGLLNLGNVALLHTRPTAGRYFEWAIQFAPHEPAPYVGVGRYLLRQGDHAAATSVLRRAVALSPGHAWGRFQLGRAYEQAGLLQDALAEWKNIRAIPWMIDRGRQAHQAHHWDTATLYLDAARSVAPLNPEAVYLLALTRYEGLGDADGAISLLQEAIAAAPQSPEAAYWWLALGWIYDKEGRWQAAKEAYGQATAVDATNSAAHLGLGRVMYFGLHQLDSALLEMEQALALAPSDPVIYLQVGHLYKAERQFDQALKWYRRAALVDPLSVHPIIAEGEALLAAGEAAHAASFLQQALDQHPDTAHLYYLLAAARSRTGDHEGAVSAAQQAVALDDTGNAGYWVMLGRVCEDAGHVDQAVRAYREALALDLDRGDAQEGLRRCRTDGEGE